VATVVAQVFRYSRVSSDLERLQTKWVVFGFALSIAGILVDLLLQPRFSPSAPDPAAAAFT
jgi:hypothetical protein